MNVNEFLRDSQYCSDALTCMQKYQEGCSLMSSHGELVATLERTVALKEAFFSEKETSSKANVLAKASEEYKKYRIAKAQFAALDAAVIGLRHKAQMLANEFNHLKNEPK